jgi:peptide/nickel transport system substrate-binding protein
MPPRTPAPRWQPQPERAVKRRQFLGQIGAGLGAVAATSLLGACQQPVEPSRLSADTRPTPTPLPPSTRPAPDAKVSARAAPGVVKAGGSIVWAADADPADLDPAITNSIPARRAWGDLAYQSLVMFDENLKVTPCLAESWVAVDPARWTFTLRQGVRFHDGSELDAEDVTRWFDGLKAGAAKAPPKGWPTVIAKVEPKGRYTVDLVLEEPYAPLLATLASLRGSAIVSRSGMASGPAAGTGPFRIAEIVPNNRVRYVKHPDYWERGLPYLDEIVVRTVADENERAGLLQAGDVVSAILRPDRAVRLKSEKNVGVMSSSGSLQRLMTMNVRRPPLDDKRVRQALALAVDRRAAVERVLGGEAKLTGPIPPGHSAWSSGPEGPVYRRDVRRARQLLADAGFDGGLEMTLRVSAADPTAMPLGKLLADELRDLDVSLKVEELGPSALAQVVAARDFDLCAESVEFQPDPDGYLWSRYHGNGPLNASGWQSARFDEIVDQARAVLDPGERKRLYDEAATILLDESPAIWWFAENSVEAMRANLKGYSQSFTGRRPFLKKAWLDR